MRGSKQTSATKQKQLSPSKVASGRLKLLVTIVDAPKADFYMDLIQSFEVNLQTGMRARGTASAQMLDLLGLEETKKTVIFSLIREDRAQDALAALSEKFATIRGGKGIAYTVPLSSVIGVAIYGFLSNNDKTVKEDKHGQV